MYIVDTGISGVYIKPIKRQTFLRFCVPFLGSSSFTVCSRVINSFLPWVQFGQSWGCLLQMIPIRVLSNRDVCSGRKLKQENSEVTYSTVSYPAEAVEQIEGFIISSLEQQRSLETWESFLVVQWVKHLFDHFIKPNHELIGPIRLP